MTGRHVGRPVITYVATSRSLRVSSWQVAPSDQPETFTATCSDDDGPLRFRVARFHSLRWGDLSAVSRQIPPRIHPPTEGPVIRYHRSIPPTCNPLRFQRLPKQSRLRFWLALSLLSL